MTEALQENWRATKKYFTSRSGHTTAYIESHGAGPTLVLLHGFTDSSRSYSLLKSHLGVRHHIIPDLCGHGDSRRVGGFGLAELVTEIAALIDARAGGPTIIIGHSMGGMIALMLAHQYPDMCSALVIIASSLRPSFPLDGPLSAWIDELVDPIDPQDPFFENWHHTEVPIDKGFIKLIQLEAAGIPAEIWQSLYRSMGSLNLTGIAETINQQTLIISGANDQLFGKRHCDALLNSLSNARHVQIKMCGHNPHWEQPVIVSRQIDEFINSQNGK